MITLKVFDNIIDAHLLKTKLESEGILCFLFDVNIVGLDPLYNMAIGGIKLKIKESDKHKALEIMKEIELTKYTDEQNKALICDRCQSEEISYFRSFKGKKGFFSILVLIMFMVYPIYFKYVYKCQDCGHEW